MVHLSDSDIALMSPPERLSLIGRIWDSFDNKDIALSEEHEAILEERLATPVGTGAVRWEDLRRELLRQG